MKKASDRQSIIESALTGFEWHARLGVWLALTFANMCFLFWGNMGLIPPLHFSFLAMALLCLPWKRNKTWIFATRGGLAFLVFFAHLIIVKENFNKLPVIFMIVPIYLCTEFLRGWVAKFSMVAAFWALHAYWSAQGIISEISPKASMVGLLCSTVVLALFEGLHMDARRRARRQLSALQGKNDFDPQRIHASRLQVLGEISANLIHELANPLTNLGGFFMQLSEFEELRLSMRWKDLSKKIHANLGRMNDLLHSFRSFSRRGSSEEKAFRIDEIFSDAELLTKQAIQSKKIKFTLQEPTFDFYLMGNRIEVSQIIINFLLNAISAVEKSPAKMIDLGAELREDHFIMYVEDSGPGVDEKTKESIFRPFFTTKGEDGSGLGLYISKIIADNHSCKINVMTSRSGGARFELIFPKEKMIFPPNKKVA